MALDYIQHKTDGSGKKQRFISLDDFFFETVSIRKNHTFSFCVDLPFADATSSVLWSCIVNKTTSYIIKVVSWNLTQSVNAGTSDLSQTLMLQLQKMINIGSVSPGTSITAVNHDTSFSLPNDIYIYYKQTSLGFTGSNAGRFLDVTPFTASIPDVSVLDLPAFSTQVMRRNIYWYYKNILLLRPIILRQDEGLNLFIYDNAPTKTIRLFQECTFEVIEI